MNNATKDLFTILSFGFSEDKKSTTYTMRLGSIGGLVNNNADPNAVCHISGMPMLAYAVRTGDSNVVYKLLEHGASFHHLSLADGVKAMIQCLAWNPQLLHEFYSAAPKYDVIPLETHNEFRLFMGVGTEYSDMPIMIEKMYGYRFQDKQVSSDNLQHHIAIFDMKALNKAIDNESGRTKDILSALKDSGQNRGMAVVNEAFKTERIIALKEKFPNFSEALDYISRYVSLSSLSDKSWFNMQPLLLLGDPGIGKTKFLSVVSKALEVEFSVVGCSSLSAGFVLSGSSTTWSGGKTGMVYDTIKNGSIANPMIMLDEIDKISSDYRHDGYGPLYQLLERSTAQKFTDEAANFPMDFSNINWVATANDISTIPDPIQQRFKVIQINSPDKAQMKKIALSVYEDILDEYSAAWGCRFDSTLDTSIVEDLSAMPPREMRHKLLEAMGNAANNRTASIYHLNKDDFNSTKFKKKPGPGFLNNEN